MANKQIPFIPAAGDLDGTEQFHIVQGNNSRRLTLAELRAWLGDAAYTVSFGFTFPPDVGETLFLHAFAEDVTFPGSDWGPWIGFAEAYPTAAVTLALLRENVQFGTLTINPDTSMVIDTTGDTEEGLFVAGDVLKVVALTTDPALENVALTFKGIRNG